VKFLHSTDDVWLLQYVVARDPQSFPCFFTLIQSVVVVLDIPVPTVSVVPVVVEREVVPVESVLIPVESVDVPDVDVPVPELYPPDPIVEPDVVPVPEPEADPVPDPL